MWPNLILGGAPKCGTSSLYSWLDRHPDVGSSPVKEPFFFFDTINRFNAKANIHQHGLDAYQQLFKGLEHKKIVFEATAPYLYSKTALEQIPDLPSAPKVLFLLREPSARLLSKYRFNRYKLHNPTGEFQAYCSGEGGSFPSGPHVEEGFYSRYLEKWQQRLPKDRLRVHLMEEMLQDPQAFMKQLCVWLEISSSPFDAFSFERHNETFTTRSGAFHKKAVGWLPLVPSFVREPLARIYRKINAQPLPVVSQEELARTEVLKAYFASDQAVLAALFPELPLSLWN